VLGIGTFFNWKSMPLNTRPAYLNRRITVITLCAALFGCNSEHDASETARHSNSVENPVLSIPIHRDEDWIAEVQGPDHKPHNLLIDTGATLNVLDSQGPLAASPITQEVEATLVRQGVLYKSNADGNVTAETPSDAKQFKLGIGPLLQIQGWTVPAGLPALMTNMARVGSKGEKLFSGIIGSESMRSLTWRADYVAGKLTGYANAGPAHDWQQCTFMTLDTNSRMPIIELTLGDESNWFGLDTGDNADISLPQETFAALDKAAAFESHGEVTHYDVTDRFLIGEEGLLAGLSIGPRKLPKLLVDGGSSTPRLGWGTLQKMDRFELDFRHFRFCFDLPSRPADSRVSRVGAAFVRSGDYYNVAALVPDGRLARSGVEVGDQISNVSGTVVATLNYARLRDLLDEPATDQITVQRGERTLVVNLRPVS
jgi:hypothetical protein